MVRRYAEHIWERLENEGDGLEGESKRLGIIGQYWLLFRIIFLFLGFAVLMSFFSQRSLSSWWQPGAPNHSEHVSSQRLIR
jgi:hypothetical protein